MIPRVLYYMRVFGLSVEELTEFAQRTDTAVLDARQDGRIIQFPHWRQQYLSAHLGTMRYAAPENFSCVPSNWREINIGSRSIISFSGYDAVLLMCDCRKNAFCQLESVADTIARSFSMELKPMTIQKMLPKLEVLAAKKKDMLDLFSR